MSLKIDGSGVNELYCNLIGSDLEGMREMQARKGLLEFIEPNSRL